MRCRPMRRADRLLQIVQILRRSNSAITADALAAELEVVPRTIYRDIASLQASRVPIDGAVGVGYVLRPGYDLPPLMFRTAEIEAVVLGLAMVIERGDRELADGAVEALTKIRAVVPPDIADDIAKAKLLVPHSLETEVTFGAHVPAIREAIRENRKLRIDYVDKQGRSSDRTIWPLGLYLYSHVPLVCARCEHRRDYRTFRSERVIGCRPLSDTFNGKNGTLMMDFLARFKSQQGAAIGGI
jgi:predicted DNA-binding transcriptional regulator YafY